MAQIETVETDRAPGAIGPYSQAVVTDGWIFVSGQIPLDPATGELVEGGLVPQVERVLENLREVLEAAGGGLSTVVKTTVYLSSMGDFATVNRVYAEYFGESRPARATIEAAGLPKGVAVEIDAIARVGG